MVVRTSLFLVVIAILAIGAAQAAGGIYIDNLRITSNGTSVFVDSFDQGKLVGWKKMSDAAFVPDAANKPEGALLLNKHIFCAATAYHDLSAKDAGVVEMSADIYCTAPDEQYDWRVKKLGCATFFTLYSGNSEASIATVIHLNSPQSAYTLGIQVKKDKSNDSYTRQPVLKPKEWATVTLRLDPKTSIATLLLNGQAVKSLKYTPQDFQSLREVGLCTGLGDGAKRTD